MEPKISSQVHSSGSKLAPDYLESYCRRYFKSVGATVHPSERGTVCVELPREIDKELTDRPFFWMWAEAMNENPPNTVLYLDFTGEAKGEHLQDGVKVERITPGCYRMLRIMTSAKNHGTFAAAYEPAPVVTPYALLIVKISFMSDRRKDVLASYAVDLRDYHITANVMEDLMARPLQDERPLSTKILPVPVDFDQVFALVMNCVRERVELDDHTWAKEATKRLRQELKSLDEYYASLAAEEDPSELAGTPERPSDALNSQKVVHLQTFAQKAGRSTAVAHDIVSPLTRAAEQELRRAEIVWRTEPRIEVRPLQCAMVYLASAPVGDEVI